MEFSITNESCRVCLRKSPSGKLLSEPAKGRGHVDTRSLLELYHLCTGFIDPPWLQSEANETFYPRKICTVCERLLLAAYELRKQSLKSERVLRNILQFYEDDEAYSLVEELPHSDQQFKHDKGSIASAHGLQQNDIPERDEEETEIEGYTPDDTAERDEEETEIEGYTPDDTPERDEEETEIEGEPELEPLQEAALFLAEESQSKDNGMSGDLLQEESYGAKRQAGDDSIEAREEETNVHIDYQYDASTNANAQQVHADEIAIEEYTDEAVIDASNDDVESTIVDGEGKIEEHDTDDGLYEAKEEFSSKFTHCPDCGKVVSVRYLSKHRETHMKTQRYECEICKMRFTFRENLVKHIRIHRNDKKYKCPHCQELFLHWGSRRYHIDRVHTNEKRFACEHCGSKFRHSSHYKNHLRRHTGSTPYACSTCSRAFISKNSLKEHMVSHSDQKNFTCVHCRKQYKSMKSLNVHLKTHNSTKEYSCSVCGKTFSQNHSLRTHHMKAHPEFELPPPGTLANIKAISCLKPDEL